MELTTGKASSFWIRIEIPKVSNKMPDTQACWLWVGRKNSDGYGIFKIEGKYRYAHRLVYEQDTGEPIPSHLESSHVCHNRACVNPHHIILETHQENMQRSIDAGRAVKPRVKRKFEPKRKASVKEHCPSGHPYAEHLYVRPNGKRYCRKCHSIRESERLRRKREGEESSTFKEKRNQIQRDYRAVSKIKHGRVDVV